MLKTISKSRKKSRSELSSIDNNNIKRFVIAFLLFSLIRGKFGVVYKCQDKSTGNDVAVKVMLRRHNKKEDVEREVAILKQISHPRVLTFADYKEDGGNFILVTEL